MFQRLLVCTDLADGVYRLAQFVPSLAIAGVQQVTFLHAVPLREDVGVPRPDEEQMTVARDRLAGALHSVPEGVQAQVLVESGKPLDLILRAIQDYKPDVIVLGMPTRNLLTERLFGSTTLGLCQKTSVPLLILRPQVIESYTAEELDLRCRHLVRRLLVPYDGTLPSQFLLQQVQALAQRRPPQSLELCHLCWAIEAGGRLPKDAQLEAAQAALPKAQAVLEATGLQVTTAVRLGTPVVEVLAAAVAADVSAIAVSSGSMGTLREWSIPSFTSELLRRSWRPLLYFPAQK
jgi:nucleotide-binding universal stress UspA family protein